MRAKRTVAAALLAIVVAGCGGDDDGERERPPATTAPKAQQELRSERAPRAAHVAAGRFVEAVRMTAPSRAVSAWRTARALSAGAVRRELDRAGSPPASVLAAQRRSRSGTSADVVAVDLELESASRAAGLVETRERAWDRGAITEAEATYAIELRRISGQWRVVAFTIEPGEGAAS